MNSASTTGLSNSRRRVLIGSLVTALIVMASRGLFSAYSYWGDEIFSVVGSQYSWGTLIPEWVMQGDVHPPFYHILLKVWMNLFGPGEIATRSLSFLCGIGAMVLLAWFTARRSFRYQLLAVLILGSSPAFAYYMQETRSYALVLLLAMALTICAMALRQASFGTGTRNDSALFAYYILSVLLSLTHYFGWIYVFCLTLINLFEARIEPRRWRSFILLVLIGIWPLIHIVYGTLGNKSGGNFWIESSVPILSTVNNMLMGVFPLVLVSKDPYRFFLFLVTGAFMIRYSLPLLRRSTADGGRSWLPFTETAYLLLVVVLLVAMLIVVDTRTPMSTPRNYIVLLPAVTFLTAGIFDSAIENAPPMDKRLLAAVAGSLVLVQLFLSQIGIREKAMPRENWKLLAQAVNATGLCRDGCYSDRANTYFEYYFKSGELVSLAPALSVAAQHRTDGSTDGAPVANPLASKSFLLSGSYLQEEGKILNPLLSTHICLEPRQVNPAVVVLVPSSRVEGLKREGLVPCRGN